MIFIMLKYLHILIMTAIIKLKIATWKQYSAMVHSMNAEMIPGYKLSAVLLTS